MISSSLIFFRTIVKKNLYYMCSNKCTKFDGASSHICRRECFKDKDIMLPAIIANVSSFFESRGRFSELVALNY